MADFTALKANTLVRAGIPSSDGLAADVVVGQAVNAAVRYYGNARLWPWLYDEQNAVTVAGAAQVALPAAASRIHWVSYADDVLDRRNREHLVGYGTDRGRPVVWAPDGDDGIYLAPVPDAVYTLTFALSLAEPTLSGASDVPLLPSRFHDIIEVRAAKFLAIRRKDPDMVSLLNDEEDDLCRALDRAILLDRGPLVPRARQDWNV